MAKHSCDICGTPVFEVHKGVIIIKAKHHGEVHTTVVSIAELVVQWLFASVSLSEQLRNIVRRDTSPED